MIFSTPLTRWIPVLLIVLFMGIAGSCEDEPTGPAIPGDTIQTIQKSPKRGLSYNLTNALDLDTLKRGVSWWYNWYHSTSAPQGYYEDYQMEFIPMIWGGNPSLASVTAAKAFILAHPEVDYLLVMNEPNLVDQANRTPQQAASDWIIYEQVIQDLANQGREIKLVGPAMNWGTLENYSDPVVWLDAFYSHFETTYGRKPLIDYLAFHWYDYGLASQLDHLEKYGKQIWITEMANWNANINSYAMQIQQMHEMVGLCESRSDVFRYAWFIGRGGNFDNRFTYLFQSEPGELTELGLTYINLPYSQ